jgi:hypothetical protein
VDEIQGGKAMSDTPRTDENEFDWVTASFARKLERQLNAANDRIKRLEEAGDALYEGWIGYGFTKDKHLAAWIKAKEAKL